MSSRPDSGRSLHEALLPEPSTPKTPPTLSRQQSLRDDVVHSVYRRIHGHNPPCPQMSRKQAYLQGPFTKWKQFGKFPMKFVCHMVLLALVTVQTNFLVNASNR